MSSYYDILKVSREASSQEIKRAYFSLAKKYHPDITELSPEEAHAKMVELNTAYAVLSDNEKKQTYDASWSSVQQGFIYADPNNPGANGAYALANEIVQKQCRECALKLKRMLGTGIAITNMEELWVEFMDQIEYTLGRLKSVGVLHDATVAEVATTIQLFSQIYTMANEFGKANLVMRKFKQIC